MTRRASLPGADELFRRTADLQPPSEDLFPEPYPRSADVVPMTVAAPAPKALGVAGPEHTAPNALRAAAEPAAVKPRHDEKVTFYCTASELTRLEKARLTLRSDHKLPSDRGRLVRAALTEMLDDFEARGSESALWRRLNSGS